METQLISITDIRNYRKIAANFDTVKLNGYINDVQLMNLRPLLGAGLYADMLANIEDANYVKLINGDDYTVSGQTVRYYGLIPYLVFHVLAMIARESDTQFTEVGNVTITGQNYTSTKDREGLENSFKIKATNYGNEILDYLNTHNIEFPIYRGQVKTGNFDLIFNII